MYNSFPSGTEAYYIMEDGIAASQTHDEAQDSFEEVIERACGTIDELESDCEEAVRERDEYEKELEELQSKYEELHATQPELITMLTNLKVATEGINKYVTDKLVSLGALNETQDIDSGPGDSGDGGAENPDGKNDGSPIT